MPFSVLRYKSLLSKTELALTSEEKGRALEDVTEYLLSLLRGVEIVERDKLCDSEELDFVLWNSRLEEVLRPWEFIILVECKNWSGPVGASELDLFVSKLRRRGLKSGIFIASNGVTGDFETGAKGIIKATLAEGIRVIVVTRADLELIGGSDDLCMLIKRRYCRLFVHKII